ncbi:MAG: hypothetical protein LHW64_10180 [Candidatus Cloacimonetes bacterium]|nr:hypothetical protein [Candidatus Cloacimonadota bacterium]MDY0230476.1 hypothetical protein [Candidatus Cloacimonadaceae bacterium]
MKDQIKDILPSFMVAIIMGAIVTGIGRLLPFGDPVTLLIQVMSGAVIVFVMAEVTRLEAYLFMKEIIHDKISTARRIKEQLR